MVYMCVFLCVWAHLCVQVLMHMCVLEVCACKCMWRAEVHGRYLPQLLSTSFYESFLSPLAIQQAQRILQSPLLQHWDYIQTWHFTRMLEIQTVGPHACVADTLPTEPSTSPQITTFKTLKK